jgi:hypothetical protein
MPSSLYYTRSKVSEGIKSHMGKRKEKEGRNGNMEMMKAHDLCRRI